MGPEPEGEMRPGATESAPGASSMEVERAMRESVVIPRQSDFQPGCNSCISNRLADKVAQREVALPRRRTSRSHRRGNSCGSDESDRECLFDWDPTPLLLARKVFVGDGNKIERSDCPFSFLQNQSDPTERARRGTRLFESTLRRHQILQQQHEDHAGRPLISVDQIAKARYKPTEGKISKVS